MAGEMNGEIFDINLSASVDTSGLDAIGDVVDKYEGKKIDVIVNPKWAKKSDEIIDKYKNKSVKMNVKLNIPDDIKKTTTQLSKLATVMERLSNYSGKNGTVSVNPIVGGGVNQTAPSRSKTKAVQTVKSNTQTLSTDVEKFNSVLKEYESAQEEFYNNIEAFNSGFFKKEEGRFKYQIDNIIEEFDNYSNAYIEAYNKLRSFSPKLLDDESINVNQGVAKALNGQYDIGAEIEEYVDEVIESINNDIKEGVWKAKRDITKEDFSINYGSLRNQTFSTATNVNTSVPLSPTVPIDMSAFAGAMSLSFDNKDIGSIKTSVDNIETSVRNISTSLQGGIPISGTSQSDPNKKPESIKLDASNLITALGDLKNSIDAKEAIIEKDANSKRIIQDNSKAQVTVEQLNAAIADSESKLNAEAARNKTIYNSIYKKMQTLVDGLKAENKEIYDSLGKNFLDVSDEQLDSFIKKLESLQENYKINIDVDIPNLDNFKAMYLTLDKAEKLAKASKKDTTKKSKTKAITPSVAKKEESVTAPVTAEVKLPENLNLLDENSKKVLDNIKTAVESINGKIKESSEVDKSKSKPKAKTAKEPEQAGAKSLLTSALSDAIGDIRTTNSSIDENVKQASASTDLIFEDVDETKQDIKEAKAIINGIYNKISNGVTVTGGVPIPSSNNSPTPIPQGNNGGAPRNRGGNNPKPANTPPASTRSRDNIIDETNRLLPEIDSEIKKINYLLASEGGVSDVILSKDDAKDLLNRLKEVESEISNIQNAVWSKKVGQKTLAAADSDLADVMSTYSSINIPQEVDTYNKVFGDSKSIRRAKEMLGTLTRFKELLNTKGIDTTAYDEAIQRLEDGIERVEETKKSWMSQKLDDSGLKLANDALTQVRDSLDGVSDATESLFEYAKNEKSEFLSFDVKIDEVEELEKSLIRLDKLIKKAKFSGVDLTSVDMGNGQTLADAEKTIERYFSEKGSLSIYSPGQFASEAEFKSYREDIELNLIQPTKLYAKTLGETEYAVNQLIQEQKELAKASNEYNKGLTLNKQISNKITELEKWRDANSKAFTIPENAAEYERFMNRLKDGTIIDQSQMKKFNAEWAEFNAQIRAAGQNGKTTGSILTAMFKKFGGWTLVTRTITQGLRLMKDMVTQVKEVDTAMVNLRKVTDASEQSLLKYQKSVQKSSIALGTTLTDQIDSTAIFSRLGYQLEEAQKLGEIASKYKTVAEDLDINTASESIISTMKAYQSMGDTAEEIVDKFNYVGNNFAISSSGIGESMQRSASSLVAANNTLSEAIALTTSANEIVQNPESVGVALKTMSARIRGAKSELEEEGEEMTMTVSKLREEIKSISGIDVMIDEHSFKSTYDILNELSKVWKDLNDTDQARIAEMLGGKVGINTVYAMLENFETARDVVKELNEGMAEGSADRELETALDSIQGKLNQIQSVWQTLSTNVIDSELVKDGLDWVVKFGEGLNDILDVLKDMKGLGTGLLAFGGMTALQAQLKNKTGSGRVKMFALDKYARVSSGGNTERVRTVLVRGKRALEKLPKLAHRVTSFMNLVREGWLRYRLIRSQAYLVGRFREYNGRAARVVMGYSRQLRERSKIIRSDSLLRWENAS